MIDHPDTSKDIWRIFRIMSEFAEGFQTMNEIGRAVTIFGSARTKPEDPYYQMAEKFAADMVGEGYAVITGGGPGIMEAANKGAYEADGVSVGLNISLPMEQHGNGYQTHELDFHYFFARKVMFEKYASAFVIFPGGFGTMDEFFESMTLIQTMKMQQFPVVLIGHKFWDGLLDWIKSTMLDEFACISPQDLDLFMVTDSIDEAREYIRKELDECGWIKDEEKLPKFARETTLEGTRLGYNAKINRKGSAAPKYPPTH